MQLRDREWRRQDFESDYALLECPKQFDAYNRIVAVAPEILRNTTRDLKEIGARAATGIENDNVGISESANPPKLRAQQVVDPPNLVTHDFGRRVPDPEILSKLRVEGL